MNGKQVEKKKLPRSVSLIILFGSAIISIIASLILGHVLETIFRITFGLTNSGWIDLAIPGILLFVFLFVGTASLTSVIWVTERWIQVGIIFSNLVLPFLIEIVDLWVRGMHVYDDFMQTYSFLF